MELPFEVEGGRLPDADLRIAAAAAQEAVAERQAWRRAEDDGRTKVERWNCVRPYDKLRLWLEGSNIYICIYIYV